MKRNRPIKRPKKPQTPFYIGILILTAILSAGFGMGAYAGKAPDAETTLGMSQKEIEDRASRMSVLELKQWADSIYFRTDLRTFPRSASEPIYRLLMLRGTRPLSPEEEKIMAAGYSNYATYLIFEKNNPVQAYPLLRRSLELLEKYKKDGLLVVGAYTNMAHIYANFNDTVKALDHLKTGFHNALKSTTPKRAGYIYAQLLLMAWEFNRIPEIQNEIRTFKSSPILKDGFLYDYNLDLTEGIENYTAGNYAAAAAQIEHALTHIDAEYDPQIYTSMTMLMSADAALRIPDNRKAKQLIDSAANHLAGYRELNGNDFLNRIQGRYYRQTGRPDLAYQCQIKSLVLRDSLYNARNMTTISDLEQDLITSRFNTELREAQLKQEILKEKNSRQQTILIIVGVASVIIITLLLFLMYKRRKLTECRYDLITQELSQQQVLPADQTQKEEDLKPLFDLIQEYFRTSREIYNLGFSIDSLAESLDMPVKQISKAINTYSGKNFSLFLSDYRIREACRILLESDPDNRPTIEWVAEQVGYRSRSHFSRTFKSVTGLTTTDFIRQSQRHRG